MKYHNQKVCAGDQVFDSRREYSRWCELRLLERAGKISDLKRQVRFRLIPAQDVDGACRERPADYIADFVYTKDGAQIVEDAKGGRQGRAHAGVCSKAQIDAVGPRHCNQRGVNGEH